MSIPSINITETASKAIMESIIHNGEKIENVYLRVGANKGGCSGWRWELETESVDNKKETDIVFDEGELKIIIDKKILFNVIGSVKIDYTSKNIVEQGFVFVRPSGQQCGCGESFTPIDTM